MPRSALFVALAALSCATPEPFDADRIRADVRWLAADEREGRGLATAGLADAARYLADGFAAAGLAPGAPDGSYLQGFDAPVAIAVTEAELALDGVPFERGVDFEALLGSANGAVEGEPVFVGHGITDRESGWDDYAGVDVEGRAVLVLDDRPRLAEGPLGGQGGGRFLRRAYKVANARRHGAAAVLLAPAEAAEGLPANAGHEDANPTRQPSDALTISISRAAAEQMVAAAGGPGLTERIETARRESRPASAPLPGVRLRASVRIERTPGRIQNVLAIRPGSDPALAGEAVVVGAHFDHLGRGEYGSLAPDRRGQVHNGADDNASGTAGLLALARALGSQPAPRRSVVLAAFTAEEVGLAGSSHYVEHAALAIDDTVAMINLDMIGRLEDGRLTVFGAESSPDFESLVRETAASVQLEVEFAEGSFAPSDQTSFHSRGVPVLFFFTGTHADYHTPDDDAERIDAAGMRSVLALVDRVARRIADAPERPALVQTDEPTRAAGGERGYGPYLGTVPAFGGRRVRGVRLQGVRSGSPAERAGLRPGDVIIGFADAPVANLEELAALLFGARAGDDVEIVVEREGVRITTRATLGQRR